MTNLARCLADAEDEFLRCERELEDLLDSLYEAWGDFERGGAVLDIYEVYVPSPAAVDALKRAGFRSIYEHDHEKDRAIACACRRRE